MPRGAAPLPPVRQTGVQICYTMAPSGPPRGRTSLDGFGDRPGRWTAALGAPCGNRTRIAGLEDRHSAVELKAHEYCPRARKGILRPSAPRFRPRLSQSSSIRPRANPMARDRENKKTPRPFERGVLTKGSVFDQIMPSPRARAAPSRPGDPTTYSPCRRRPRRTTDGESARFGIRCRPGVWPFLGWLRNSCCPLQQGGGGKVRGKITIGSERLRARRCGRGRRRRRRERRSRCRWSGRARPSASRRPPPW